MDSNGHSRAILLEFFKTMTASKQEQTAVKAPQICPENEGQKWKRAKPFKLSWMSDTGLPSSHTQGMGL